MVPGIGDRFQEETKYYPGKLFGGSLDWLNKPNIYKEYSDKNKIELPPPKLAGNISFYEVLKNKYKRI